MKNQTTLSSFLVVFLVITACITILDGVIGILFLPNMRFGYEAFFSPPLFGFLSALTGFVRKSKKDLSVNQVLFRYFLQLLIIEVIVFGLNFLCGNIFPPVLSVALAAGIAVVYIFVHVILWLNDRKIAQSFNIALKNFQASQRN